MLKGTTRGDVGDYNKRREILSFYGVILRAITDPTGRPWDVGRGNEGVQV